MKKLLALILTLALAFSALPSMAVTDAAPKQIASDAVIDTDGSDGYSGDYVVIYNPNTSGSGLSTGNMSGLIETEIAGKAAATAPTGFEADCPYRIDVDQQLAEKAKESGVFSGEYTEKESAQASFNVGDTHNFMILNYSPDGMMMEFKVLAKGEHCYIWTPTSTAANVYPLDSINPDFAQMAADEFDSKFDLMQSSFGDHDNGSSGDGRLNMLYYNIDDGWQPGQGYIGGYFYALDLYINGMPILNIDTYPGVHYVNAQGEVFDDISRSYGTMVHEYQHLINFSVVGMADTWINECMSAAAEEICYPGSSVVGRIQSWTNYFYGTNEDDDWNDNPAEFMYVPAFTLHNGFSMYDWNNDLEMDDLLVLYAQVSLFAQYIYTQYGNTTFHGLMDELAAGRDFVQGFQNVTGMNTADFVGNFRAALTANTAPDVLGGVYGFRPQEGYDPAKYHGVENPYNLLGPVVFTGSSCQIKPGGAITVKPVGGVYNPPSDAAGGLRYYGITRTVSEPEPVPLTGVDLDIHEAELHVGQTLELTAIPIPGNASDYTINWISSDESVVTVEWDGTRATVTAVGSGEAVITVRATDEVLHPDMYFSAECTILVSGVIPYPRGDIDMNGTVNINDAVLALRHSMGIITLTDAQLAIGDMDGDGRITVTDALTIMRIAMGIA